MNIPDVNVSKKLLEESVTILARSEILQEEANQVLIRVMTLNKNRPPKDISWEEKERIYKDADKLMEEVRSGIEKLKQLDDDYNELCERVNTHFGEKIMRERHSSAQIKELYEEMMGEDGAEWWKRES